MPEAPSLEDQPTTDHYRTLLAERGWPPIKGGSPELDEESGGEDLDAIESPDETDQTDGEQESLDDFDYSEIPDDLKETVEKRIKGFQASYTKAMQGVSEKTREAEQATQVINALRQPNPQLRAATLAHLGITEKDALEMFGYQLPDDEPEEEPDLYDEVNNLKQWKAQQEQTAAQAQREEQVTDYISGEIASLEKKAGKEFDANAHRLLDAYARQYANNGVPDVAGAYELLSGLTKAEQKSLLDGKRNTARPPGGGKPGSRTVDLSKETPEQRKERMTAAVEAAQASGE